MKKYKLFILIVVLLVVIALFITIFLFNKKLDSTADLKADLELNAISLLVDYQADEVVANAKYLDKIIEIHGRIAEIQYEKGGVVILLGENDGMEYIQCTMLPAEIEKVVLFKVSDEVTIRGYCAGYLFNVIINRAIFVDDSNQN